MNIIALSLGLAPVPPLPPETQRRQNQIADDRERAGKAAQGRAAGVGLRTRILELLRDTGPATAAELASYFGQTLSSVKHHLESLRRGGKVQQAGRRGNTNAKLWEAV